MAASASCRNLFALFGDPSSTMTVFRVKHHFCNIAAFPSQWLLRSDAEFLGAGALATTYAGAARSRKEARTWAVSLWTSAFPDRRTWGMAAISAVGLPLASAAPP